MGKAPTKPQSIKIETPLRARMKKGIFNINVVEAITIKVSIVSLLPVVIVVNEQVKVAEEPEASVVGQTDGVLVAENIKVENDANLQLSASLNISELIQVIDRLYTVGWVPLP